MDANELLAEAEMRAERIVAFVRLAIPMLGGMLTYATVIRSPIASESRVAEQVPFVIAFYVGYFAVGLISLALARPERFRGWMPWAFTTCDLGFWFALLAASVGNFGLLSNQIVLSPAIWVAPFVLILAALHYNTWLQAYATAFVVTSLLALAIFTPSNAGSAVSARGELDFLFQTNANVLRLGILVLVGLALIVTVARARGLLNRAVAETVRRANLTRYLPPQLVGRMAETSEETMRTGRQQDAAVLFVDIRDFTARAEGMEPVALSHFLADFRRVVTRAVDEWGGVVDKFVGDSAMIVFGVPEPSMRDASNALNAGRAILDAVASWNNERGAVGDDGVRIGVGVHWGRVFCGAVGDASRLEFTVLGDTVNVAARLEEATKKASLPLVVSEALLTAAGVDPIAEAGWIALPDTAIRGRDGDVRHYGRL